MVPGFCHPQDAVLIPGEGLLTQPVSDKPVLGAPAERSVMATPCQALCWPKGCSVGQPCADRPGEDTQHGRRLTSLEEFGDGSG